MRFAARENAVLGQIEVGAGTLPGAGAVHHLARLLGRGRAMEAILGSDDFDAEQAERYGWIDRAVPDADLDAFVARLARRIGSFPTDAVRTAKRVLNELTLSGADAVRADARRFRQLVVSDAAQDPHRRWRRPWPGEYLQGHVPAAPAQSNLGSQLH
jgi:enoyl-CoA hydratase/carnithine racemase